MGVECVDPGDEPAEGAKRVHFRPDGLFRLRSPRKHAVVTGNTCIQLEDVDAHDQRAKAAGAVIIRELADTPYGSRD